MRRLLFAFALIVPFTLVACEGEDAARPLAENVSAADLTRQLAASYDEGLGSLVTLRVFGAGTSLYYIAQADSAGAEPMLRFVRDPEAGPPTDPSAANLLFFYPPDTRYLASHLDSAAVSGPTKREGADTYILESNDPSDAGIPSVPGTADHLVRVYLDARTLDVRELFHQFRLDTMATPLSQRILYDDYREVTENVRLPFRVRQIQQGLRPSDQDVIVRGAPLAIREQQAQSLPPAQREAELQEIAREKERLVEGINELTLQIDSVRVNVPKPRSLSPL